MRSRLTSAALCFFLAASASAAQDLAAQKSVANGVTVRATPRALPDGAWEFDIVFDTHTQELKDEPATSASLVAGGKTFAPAGWQGDPPGGHHRKGVLKFDAVAPPPPALELRISRPGEAKARIFRWELK